MDFESLFLLAALIALAIAIGSTLGFVSYARISALGQAVSMLEARVAELESRPPAAETAIRREAAPEPSAPEPTRPEEAAVVPVAAEVGGEEPPAEEATASRPTPPPLPQPPPLPPRPARGRDIEEAIGTRWAVWIGGLALGLGGIFLVRYSIEAGYLGPAARIAAAFLFAALLLAGGEWLRRTGLAEPSTETAQRAYVPGVLTAAGIVAAFAAGYAAYFLYGFLGDLSAFVLLSVIAFSSLALALLHGPGLAGLGLAASYATPVMVSSSAPSMASLSVYLLLVTAAALGLARLRLWRWLAITAVSGSVLWSLFMIAVSGGSAVDDAAVAFHTAASFALAFAIFVLSVHDYAPEQPCEGHDGTAVAMLSLFALPAIAHVGAFETSAPGVGLMMLMGTALVLAAHSFAPVRLTALTAVATVLLGYAAFDVLSSSALYDPATGAYLSPEGIAAAWAQASGRLATAGTLIGLFFAALGLFGALTSASRPWPALAGTAIPLGIAVVCYLRTADFAVSYGLGAVCLALAAYFAGAAESFVRRFDRTEPGADGAVAVYAVAAVAGIGAGVAVSFERAVLTIALALIVPAIAWVEAARPVKGLRLAAAVVAFAVAGRFVWDPAVVGADLSTTPIFNGLLYGYGVPAAAFAFAAWRFGRTRMDGWVPVFEALAVVFTTLTAVMLIHHAMNDGRIFTGVSSLPEQGLLVMSMLAVSLGMQWLGVRRPGLVFSKGTLVVGAIGLLMAAGGLLVGFNPMETGETIDGGAFDGALILGYLLPGLMCFAVAALAARRADRPDWYVRGGAALGGILTAFWTTLAVRAAWHVGDLRVGEMAEGELYAYSAVWLTGGLVLLGAGVAARSRTLRLISAAVVVAVVAKVFLVDTAGLTGGLRAASFIGLGAVLVAVGLAYQRFLRRSA